MAALQSGHAVIESIVLRELSLRRRCFRSEGRDNCGIGVSITATAHKNRGDVIEAADSEANEKLNPIAEHTGSRDPIIYPQVAPFICTWVKGSKSNRPEKSSGTLVDALHLVTISPAIA